jgi:hypothetical protein
MSVLLYLDCVPGKEDWQRYRRNKDTVRLAGLEYALDEEGWQLFTEELGAGRTVTRYACATFTLKGADADTGAATPLDARLEALIKKDHTTKALGPDMLWLPYGLEERKAQMQDNFSALYNKLEPYLPCVSEPVAPPPVPAEADLGLDSEEVQAALKLLKEKTGQDWTPLDREGRQVLFVTKDIVEARMFHAEHRPVASWAGSDLRSWLNGAFCEGWGVELRGMIAKRPHMCRAYPDYYGFRIPTSAATSDEVFALSIDEAQWYFPEWESRRASFDGSPASRWLRSPGGVVGTAASVNSNGDVNWASAVGTNGVRPALWLNLKS